MKMSRLYVLQKVQNGNKVESRFLHRKIEYRKYLSEIENASTPYKIILVNQLKHLNDRFTLRLLREGRIFN